MRSRTLYINDKTTAEDPKIEFATLKYELHKIINESIDVLENLLFLLVSFLHHNQSW